MNRRLKVGLFGFGNVGRGFYELASRSEQLNLEIISIGIKDSSKHRKLDSTYFTTSTESIIDDPEIDIIVELIDDADVALEILKRSLEKRKPVVTANKKMLGCHLSEIYRLQKKYNTPVLYEGAVCGSIPIIRNLEKYYAFDTLTKIEGILNGSTNYILTKMIDEKLGYKEALNQAQSLGYAESDPTLDVNGFDSKYKLAILFAHTFGLFIDPNEIVSIGINKISNYDIQFAKRQGCTIKLVARAEKIGNKIYSVVAPQFVPINAPLAQIKNEFNGISIIGMHSGPHLLVGKGAGSLPTGLAVLSDVATLTSNPDFHYRYLNYNRLHTADFGLFKVYVSFREPDLIKTNHFIEFIGGSSSQNFHSMEGMVSTQKLIEWADRDDLSVIISKDHNFELDKAEKALEFSLVD